jgi:hypothetical protein
MYYNRCYLSDVVFVKKSKKREWQSCKPVAMDESEWKRKRRDRGRERERESASREGCESASKVDGQEGRDSNCW